MKRLKTLCAVLSAVFIILTLSACGAENTRQDEAAKDSIYNFENYESDEVFNINKVSLSGELAEKCTSYEFTYLSDGLKIKAYISIPVSMEKTQKPGKCVLYNRGGNRNFSKLENDTTANICAVCDRVVIGSQYRGADGSDGEDEFGGGDLNDVIKLIDLCENNFSFIDMDDFCAAGVSRGGVMTYPAARRDSRIKRIIAISAITDLFDSYNSRDDMKTVLTETIGCTPEENPEEYKKRSAVYWADEIKVPVMIIHSKLDEQVSYKQAEALYEKLKDSTECKLVSHNDDTHGYLHRDDTETIRNWLNN